SALETENAVVFLRDEESGEYRSAYACFYSKADGRAVSRDCASRLPRNAATVMRLAHTGDPLELDGNEPGYRPTAAKGFSRLRPEEWETLSELKAALLLPLKTRDALAGFVSLGPRLGDLPFSGEDKQLLQSVSDSASFALENAQLLERAIAEARRRQEVQAGSGQSAQ